MVRHLYRVQGKPGSRNTIKKTNKKLSKNEEALNLYEEKAKCR